jgi:hypothetical protein
MQAATAGDQYSWALTESDGSTPFPLTGVSSVEVAIAGPYTTQTAALAAADNSGIPSPATYTGNTISWVTTIQGNNGATATTYPDGGYYTHQIVINYTSGLIAKSRLFVLQLLDSII